MTILTNVIVQHATVTEYIYGSAHLKTDTPNVAVEKKRYSAAQIGDASLTNKCPQLSCMTSPSEVKNYILPPDEADGGMPHLHGQAHCMSLARAFP